MNRKKFGTECAQSDFMEEMTGVSSIVRKVTWTDLLILG